MAIQIPPPPTNSPQGDRVWTDWYIKLNQILSSTAGVAWDLVDKTGSSLSDIATRAHSQLQGILGTGPYHISASESTAVTNMTTSGHAGLTNVLGTGALHISAANATLIADLAASGLPNSIYTMVSLGANPTTSDIASGKYAVVKNTALNEIRLWVNDGGTMKKSVALT